MSETPKNPYRPGAATAPLHLAGRDPQIARFRKILDAAPEIPANLRLIGLRGVGKSVLLKELESEAKARQWATVRVQLEPRHNSEAELTVLIEGLARTAGRRMSVARQIRGAAADMATASRQLLTLTVDDVTFGFGGASSTATGLATVLLEASQSAVKTGHAGFVLMLDEAQVVKDDKDRTGDHPLSLLIAAVNAIQEAGLPLGLVLCGLPTLRANLQKARTYSERMFRGEQIGALDGNPGPARDAFVIPLERTGTSADEPLIDRVLDEVEGYPFFIQLWGAELWDAARDAGATRLTVEMLDHIEDQIYERLDEEFYSGRLETLTPSEQDLLMVSGKCDYPPLKTADIRNHSSKSDGNINVLMGRLAEQGVLFRVQKGQYEYTAPKFHEYLKRRDADLRRRQGMG